MSDIEAQVRNSLVDDLEEFIATCAVCKAWRADRWASSHASTR
jgi:hypothetical protein